MTHDEMIAIIRAHQHGKTIQVDWFGTWADVENQPLWNFGSNKYRVKPEPREFWVNTYTSVNGEKMCIGHNSKAVAETEARGGRYERVAVHMREVTE